jgi:hypothetical protein
MRLRRENGAGFALVLTSRLSAINQADRILEPVSVFRFLVAGDVRGRIPAENQTPPLPHVGGYEFRKRILDTSGEAPSQSKSWRVKKEAVAHHNGLEKSLPPLTFSGARHVE